MKHNSIRQMWQALRVFMLLFACCVSSIAWGQGTNSVKGHITDGNGEPLIGVSILVKNTNNGTVSDLDGNFTLSVNPGDILRVTDEQAGDEYCSGYCRFGTRSECCTEFWTSWYGGKCKDSWNRYFLQCWYRSVGTYRRFVW